jgi:hypothetical protein
LPNGKILLAGYSLGIWASFTVAQYKKDGVIDQLWRNGSIVVSTYPYLRIILENQLLFSKMENYWSRICN